VHSAVACMPLFSHASDDVAAIVSLREVSSYAATLINLPTVPCSARKMKRRTARVDARRRTRFDLPSFLGHGL
jgi:hypothetical protein